MRAAKACWRASPHRAQRIAACATRSLRAELALYPKPGLVSMRDSGAHADMDAATFLRSIAALHGYFAEIADAGWRGLPFAELRRLGLLAEARMLEATGGVNTHRGAIFTLGLLAAAAGTVAAYGEPPTDERLQQVVRAWRPHLIAFGVAPGAPASHGRIVAVRYGAAGARGEAAGGLPGVFDVGLPALRFALARTTDVRVAQLHALFALLARVADTNLLYRGGRAALDLVQREAAAFLEAGSVFTHRWLSRAEALHRCCRDERISPGGCADLLGACWFVHLLQTEE